MGRLIDADVFEKFIKEKYADGEKAEDIKEQLLFDLSCQPTVYDVDAVVEQLENRSTLSRPVGWTKSYEIVTLDDAIEIVKGGGVDAN